MINKQLQTTVDSNKIGDIKQNIPEGTNKSNNWKFAEVTDPIQCRSMKLQDPLSTLIQQKGQAIEFYQLD